MNDTIRNFVKNLIPWLFFLLAGIFFLQMNDESRTPITINAHDMTRHAGYEDGTAIGLTPDSQYSGAMLTSSNYLLDAGRYTLGVAYRTDGEDDELVIYDNGKKLKSGKLDPDLTYQEFSFKLKRSCPNFQFTVNYAGESNLLVQSVTLIPKDRFYTDTSFLIILFVLTTAAVWFWRFYRAKNGSHIRDDYVILTVVGIGIFSSLPYLKTGLSWAVDLCYHLIRIEGIKDGLLSGQFPVVIYPEALSGNGYLNCMYPNLFLYIPAFLRMKGVSMADSFKFLVFICNILTAYLTYHCVKTIGGNRRAALLASLLYTCCPYRFTNIYARGAVGEFLAMTFFPPVLAGLYHILIGNRRKWWYLVLGMTGLLQTHILSVTLGGAVCAVLSLVCLRQLLLEKRIIEMGKAVLASVLLNIGFLVPFLDFYQNGDLWMDALELGTYQEYTMNLSGLLGLQTTGGYYTLTFGLPLAICAGIALAYVLIESHGEQEAYLRYLFVLGAACTFMMLNFFPGWKMMSIPLLDVVLNKIQFAWRLLGPASLLFAVTGSICCFRSKMLKRYSRMLLIALAAVSMLSAARFREEDFAYSTERDYTLGHESKLIGIPKGANTVVYPFEWRPRHTTDKALETKPILSDINQISLKNAERKGVTTTLEYTCLSPEQYIEVPVIYYKGYEAKDENGNAVALEEGDNNRIRVMLTGDGKPHTITLDYRSPVSYTISAWVSILTCAGLLTFGILSRFITIKPVIRKENKDVRQNRSADSLL